MCKHKGLKICEYIIGRTEKRAVSIVANKYKCVFFTSAAVFQCLQTCVHACQPCEKVMKHYFYKLPDCRNFVGCNDAMCPNYHPRISDEV